MDRRDSRELRADTAEEWMIAEPRDLEYGGPEWSEQLRSAIREAVAEAVTEHQKAGNPVYFTDDAGCLCVMMPDGHERRLTDLEIEVLTRSQVVRSFCAPIWPTP
jgi:hypothetical protein